jgi:hypothetical protein
MNHQGFKWLIRAKEGHRVEYQGQTYKVGEIAEKIETHSIKNISYKGNQHTLHVGETHIRITRAAKPKQKIAQGSGLLLSREMLSMQGWLFLVQDGDGKKCGEMVLLSNVAIDIDTAELSTWYYWRWTIECYFQMANRQDMTLKHGYKRHLKQS